VARILTLYFAVCQKYKLTLKGHTSVPDHLQQVFTLKTRLKQEASLSNNSCSCS